MVGIAVTSATRPSCQVAHLRTMQRWRRCLTGRLHERGSRVCAGSCRHKITGVRRGGARGKHAARGAVRVIAIGVARRCRVVQTARGDRVATGRRHLGARVIEVRVNGRHAGRQPVEPVLQDLPPAEIDESPRAAGDRSRGTVMITDHEVNRDRLVVLAAWSSQSAALRNVSRLGIGRCPSAARRGSRQVFLTRDQPPSSDWIHGPAVGGPRRYGQCHRRVGVFDPQREPECAAAVLAGAGKQQPGELREQILLALCPFERAREVAGPAEYLRRGARRAQSAAPRAPSPVRVCGVTRAGRFHQEPAALRQAAGPGRRVTAGARRRARHAVGCRRRRARTGRHPARAGSSSVLSRVKVAVRSHACWTFSSTRAPPSLSRLTISAPRLANRDGQPYTGPGFARINSNVTLAAPRRAVAFASETRNVPGSRSCGPSRSQIRRRLLRTRAAARPSVGRLSSATSKKVNSGSAASANAGYAACG